MLSAKGNPTMDNLTAIFTILRKKLNVEINVYTTVYGKDGSDADRYQEKDVKNALKNLEELESGQEEDKGEE
jgi:hypothetical protein